MSVFVGLGGSQDCIYGNDCHYFWLQSSEIPSGMVTQTLCLQLIAKPHYHSSPQSEIFQKLIK